MPSIRFEPPPLEEWGRAATTADNTFAFLARGLYPLALAALLASGFYLKYWAPPQAWEFYPGVRALHVLSGLVAMLVLLFRLAAGLVKRWPRAWRRRRVAALPVSWGPLLLEGAFWLSLGVLVLSGVSEFAGGWLRVPQPWFHPEVGWGFVHGVAGVYFTGFLVLRWMLWGRKNLAALRRYLYSA